MQASLNGKVKRRRFLQDLTERLQPAVELHEIGQFALFYFVQAMGAAFGDIKVISGQGKDARAGVLTKPINSKLLLMKIASILRLNQMRSQQFQSEIKQQVNEQSRQQIIAAWEVNDYLSEKFRLFMPEQYLTRIAPKRVESIQLENARESN